MYPTFSTSSHLLTNLLSVQEEEEEEADELPEDVQWGLSRFSRSNTDQRTGNMCLYLAIVEDSP